MDIDLKSNTGHQRLVRVPPDGGWGWMVTAGCAITSLNISIVAVFGLLYGKHLEEMGSGAQDMALVGNVMFLFFNGIGPVSGQMINRTSYRQVAITGSLIFSFGLILSSFSTTVFHLIVTYGILMGIGVGMIMSSLFVAVNSYFVEKKGRAVGLYMAGTGIGQVLMPFAVKHLLNEYSFQGTAFILGGFCLNGVVGGLLLQPVRWHMVLKENKYYEEGKELLEKQGQTQRKNETNLEGNDKVITKGADVPEENFVKKEQSYFSRIATLLNLQLLLNVRFITIVVGACLTTTSMLNYEMMYPSVLNHMIKTSKENTALAMSVTAGGDLLGRFIVPVITDRHKIKAFHCLLFACIYLAIVRQIILFNIPYSAVLIVALMTGLGKTLIAVYHNLAVSELCRHDQVPSAIGLYMMFKGIMILPTGFFIGWIRDYTDSYAISITALNAMMVFVVLMWTPLIIIDIRKSKKSNCEHHDFS